MSKPEQSQDSASVGTMFKVDEMTKQRVPAWQAVRAAAAVEASTQRSTVLEQAATHAAVKRAQSYASSEVAKRAELAVQIQQIAADRGLSDVGKQQKIGEVRATAQQRAAATRSAIQNEANLLRTSAEVPRFKQPATAATHDKILRYLAKAGQFGRDDLIAEIDEALAVARSTKSTPAEKFDANVFLKEAGLPHMRRTADAPERWAKPFAELAGHLADTIQEHLDVTLGKPAYEAADEFASALESQAEMLQRALFDPNTRDSDLNMIAPALLGAPKIGRE